jgi:hypothetical protein
MFITPNMGLRAWDAASDAYDYGQLANNFKAIDNHDHTVGKGARIPTGGLQDGAISTVKIQDNAVTATKIPDGSVSSAKLQNNSVTGAKIVDGAVGTVEIADGAITPGKLDPSVLPVGSVIMWFRVDNTVPLPNGWEVMDGRSWSSIPNQMGPGGTNWTTGNMPDFSNRFPIGAGLSSNGSGPSDNPSVGQIGGGHTINLQHAHNVNPHSHTVNSHTHTTPAIPGHKHRFLTDVFDSGGNWIGNAWTDLMQRGTAVPASQGKRQALYVPGRNSGEYFGENVNVVMETTGAVGASVTGADSPATSADGATTDNNLSAVTDIRPRFLSMLFIMKVRNG